MISLDAAAVSAVAVALASAVTRALTLRTASKRAEVKAVGEAQDRVVDSAAAVVELYETAIQRETARFKDQLAQEVARNKQLYEELERTRKERDEYRWQLERRRDVADHRTDDGSAS